MATSREFGTVDWVIFVAILVVSMAIGVFYAIRDSLTNKSGDASEFLLAGRNLRAGPAAVSVAATTFGAGLVLSMPAEMYTAGTQFALIIVGGSLASILAALIFVPLLYPLQLTSSYEYLELRFQSRMAKLTGTCIMIVQQVITMGLTNFAPSTAFEAVTGIPTWVTIVIVGGVATFYTCVGGMKAVIWTDVFQAAVMVAGILAMVIKGTIEVGGLGAVWRSNEEWGRIEFWEPDPDPTLRHSFWSIVVGGALSVVGQNGVAQSSVQRYSAVGSLLEARSVILWNILGLVIIVGFVALGGIVMFAYYAEVVGCDPLSTGQARTPNQLVPLFVMDVLAVPGLSGLFVATLFAGALITQSSTLNAIAAVTWQDILKPVIGHRVTSEPSRTWIVRLLVLFYGGAGIGVAFLVQNMHGTIMEAVISLNGATGAPLTGVFLLGALFPWANWKGCVAGGVTGLGFALWISIGAYSVSRPPFSLDFPTDNCTSSGVPVGNVTLPPVPHAAQEISGVDLLYTVSYLWYPAIGIATTIMVGLVTSFITGPMRLDETDPKYLIPLFDRMFCCLPESIRRILRCNLDYRTPEEIAFEEKAIQMKVNGTAPFEGITKTAQGNHYTPSPDGGVAIVSFTKL